VEIPQEEVLDLDEANDSEEVEGLRRGVSVGVSLGLRGLKVKGADQLRGCRATSRRWCESCEQRKGAG
jgi:hypothetical protein